VLAVTGSAGKTTVKEMTAHIVEAGGPVFKSPGNFNTVEGLSRAILSLEEPPRVAVLEAGASKPGEIARLAAIALPTAAAVTNIAAAHLEGFGTLGDVAREKGDLLRAVGNNGLAVVNGDDAYLLDAAAKLDCRVLRVGFGPANDWRVVHREPTPEGGSRFRLADGREGVLQVPGEHQLRNALTALALAREAGVPIETGIERLATFASVAGRLVVRDHQGVVVLDDTYNANPLSMRAALAVLRERSAPRKAVVLGDMLELGAESKKYHADLGRWVAELAPDLAVFVGQESRAAFEEAVGRSGDKQMIRHAVDSDSAARILETWVRPGDAVLVKGSRGVRMERVVRALVPSGDAPHAV
jgi:UDP-N-acetylmuramoyl-tripeptide--D-alanyl-D-alanine ligase